VFERAGEPVAIAQLLDKALAGMRVASRLNRGPLFLDPDPPGDVVRDVYGALRRHWQYLRGVLVMAPALPAAYDNYLTLAFLGFRDRHLHGWKGARVDLQPDEEQLLMGLASTWRNRLRSSLRSGLKLRVSQTSEDVDWLVARHADNMRDKEFNGPSPALVRALYDAAPDDFLVFQALLGDQPVGGMGIFTFSHTAEYYVGWFGPGGRRANVSNFMYWEIALEMKRRGYSWFDLGGIELANVGHFKRGMRGEEYELLNEWYSF
jgi:Acetyltransferase (GNAT) domain